MSATSGVHSTAAGPEGRIQGYWYPRSRVVVFKPQGPLDDPAAVYLRRKAQFVLARGRTRMVINLEGVTRASSTGVQVLIELRDEAREHGGDLVLVETPKDLLFIIDRLGLTDAFLFMWKERHAVDFLRCGAA